MRRLSNPKLLAPNMSVSNASPTQRILFLSIFIFFVLGSQSIIDKFL